MISFPNSFTSPTDIANRALSNIGADHKLDDLLTDVSKNQRECFSVYSKLRQAELERNVWTFATRRSIIRPIATDTMAWTPPSYDANTVYRVGQIVSYDDGYGSRLWINSKQGTTNVAPGSSSEWQNYSGPVTAQAYVSDTGYYSGDLVYVSPDDGTYKIYLSLANTNQDDPSTADDYDANTIYSKGQIVVYNSQRYISLVDLNKGNTPDTSVAQWATTTLTDSTNWVEVGGTLEHLSILYPLNAGPVVQSSTLNCYPLPYGYLRKAPQNPKAGSVSIFGAPTNREYDDWLIEGSYLLTRNSMPINFRFVADVTLVTAMTPMFCEGLAARMGYELCEPITQSTEKQRNCSARYSMFMREARLVNAIENDGIEPPLDDWIQCRL